MIWSYQLTELIVRLTFRALALRQSKRRGLLHLFKDQVMIAQIKFLYFILLNFVLWKIGCHNLATIPWTRNQNDPGLEIVSPPKEDFRVGYQLQSLFPPNNTVDSDLDFLFFFFFFTPVSASSTEIRTLNHVLVTLLF